MARKSGIRLFDDWSMSEKNAVRVGVSVSENDGGGDEECGGRYVGGIEGRNDESIDRVLVGIGREVEDDGDDRSAEACSSIPCHSQGET